MAELKTKPTQQSVTEYLDAIPDEKRRRECYTVLELMEKAAQEEPRMWGDSMVGFGSYHYKYASGHEGDAFLTGFASRKNALTVYILAGFEGYSDLMAKLGKYKTGRSCLYIKKLEDIDLAILEKLVSQSVEHMRRTNSTS
jgi:hypothetical protein